MEIRPFKGTPFAWTDPLAQIDEARIGMLGVSMGGGATFRALVVEECIKVAAPIIASPYLDEVPQDVPTVSNPEIQQALEAYSENTVQPTILTGSIRALS